MFQTKYQLAYNWSN